MEDSQAIQQKPLEKQTLRRMACLILVPILSFAIVSCTSVSDKDLISAGGLLLREELDSNYNDEIGGYAGWGAPWEGDPLASEGKLDPERMPDWARQQYVACVYWEGKLYKESTIRQPGDDIERVRVGSGWGWILLDKDLNSHILETDLQWTITEDGEEVDSFSRTFVDAWDEPEEST